MQQNDAVSILLTGRAQRGFAELIERMVKSRKLRFDMVVLRPETGPSSEKFNSTMDYKQRFLKDLIYTYSEADELRIYEDRVKQ